VGGRGEEEGGARRRRRPEEARPRPRRAA